MRREKGSREVIRAWSVHPRGLLGVAVLVILIGPASGSGQDRSSLRSGSISAAAPGQNKDSDQADDGPCRESVTQTSGSYKFRREGESFEIPINDPGCPAVALELYWSNGRNNGSNFLVTFFDGDNQRIYTKELSGFLTGSFQFALASIESQRWVGSSSITSVASVPAKVVIQTVRPFAFPANISYTITRAAGHEREPRRAVKGESEAADKGKVSRPKVESADSADCTSGKAKKP